MTIPFSARPIDPIEFKPAPSQGCFKCKKRIRSDSRVFLNEDMQIVPIVKKSEEMPGLRRTISNLQKLIANIEKEREHDKDEIMNKVNTLVKITEENNMLLKLATLEKILGVINDPANDSDPD